MRALVARALQHEAPVHLNAPFREPLAPIPELIPEVRDTPALRRLRTRGAPEVTEIARQLSYSQRTIKSIVDPTNDYSVSASPVQVYDVTFSGGARWQSTTAVAVRPYAGLGIASGHQVMVNVARVAAALDDGVPDECVRLATSHPSTMGAGAMFGALKVEKAGAERAA